MPRLAPYSSFLPFLCCYGGIIGFRAGWGVGNALFIATSLAVIVASASGGFAGAIVLYETALGLGIAVGPLRSADHAAATLTSTTTDFLAWSTTRLPWRTRVTIEGDQRAAATFLDAINLI